MKHAYATIILRENENKIDNDFVIQLPRSFQASSNLFISLESLDIQLKHSFPEGFYMGISIQEATNHPVVKENRHLMRSFYVPENCSRFSQEVKHPYHLSLRDVQLTRLTIRINNLGVNAPLQLSETSKSFLCLKIAEKEDMENPLYLRSEVDIPQTGPLRMQFPHHISTPPGYTWEMAIMSLGMSNPNYNRDNYHILTVGYNQTVERFPFGSLKNVDIPKRITELTVKAYPETAGKFIVHIIDGKIHILNISLPGVLRYQFSDDLGFSIGVSSSRNSGGMIINAHPRETFIFNEKLPLALTVPLTKTMLIRSPQIQSSIINEKYSQILRAVPFPKDDSYVHIDFDKLHFYEITPSSLSSIDLYITDENLSPLPPNNYHNKIVVDVQIRFIKYK